MGTVLRDRVVVTDYGQFDLGWKFPFGFDGHFDRFLAGQVNGLVGAGDANGVYLNLARRSGGSQVRIELVEQPADHVQGRWEDVVEVSVAIPAGADPWWSSWAGEDGGALVIPSGDYRLRVSARGRDDGRDHEWEAGVVDFYLLELWPAPLAADAIVRVGSAGAAYWHREVGGRRSRSMLPLSGHAVDGTVFTRSGLDGV